MDGVVRGGERKAKSEERRAKSEERRAKSERRSEIEKILKALAPSNRSGTGGVAVIPTGRDLFSS
jgi:hypothetical protein